MKNTFLTFVFLMAASFAFASNEIIKPLPVNTDSSSEIIFKKCNIKIKGTIDGKEIDLDITIDADDCAVAAGKLLKAQL